MEAIAIEGPRRYLPRVAVDSIHGLHTLTF